MHGLVLSAVQSFVTDRFGLSDWLKVAHKVDLVDGGFEPMLVYPDGNGAALMDAICAVIKRPKEDILEDIGTFLVTSSKTDAVRRLLRFGGVTFEEFLHSLDDLPERARLAVPELDLPSLRLCEHSSMNFSLISNGQIEGFGHVMTGLLRAIADDYGALAFVEYHGGGQGMETVSITLLETTFATGRDFHFGADVA